MNELVLKEMNQDMVIYLYNPEGKGEFGEIVYSFADKAARVSRKSSDDKTGYYADMAILKVEKCVQANNLPLKFIQAWY